MGMFCPECGNYEPFTASITHDFRPARKASDVIARRLGCGHTVGGEAYEMYEKSRKEILNRAGAEIRKIEKNANDAILAAFKDIAAKNEVL